MHLEPVYFAESTLTEPPRCLQSGIVGMVVSKTELLAEEVVDIDQIHDRSFSCLHGIRQGLYC